MGLMHEFGESTHAAHVNLLIFDIRAPRGKGITLALRTKSLTELSNLRSPPACQTGFSCRQARFRDGGESTPSPPRCRAVLAATRNVLPRPRVT